MEEYIEKLISQIRCKKARPYITEEIRNHIIEQKNTNIENGMSEDEALKEAVRDMGDPVEVGVSLDKVHRPGISIKLLAIIGILSILGLLIHSMLRIHYVDFGLDESNLIVYRDAAFSGYIYSLLQGFIVMLVMYLLDYTVIAKYSRLIGFALLVLELMRSLGILVRPGNGKMYIGYGPIAFSVITISMLFIPIYGAILYKLRNGKALSIIEALAWIIVQIYISTMLNPMLNRVCLVVIYYLSMLSLLSFAISRGWFNLPIKKTLILLWSISLPLFTFFIALKYRLYSVLPKGMLIDPLDLEIIRNVRLLWRGLGLFGKSQNEIFYQSMDYNGELILSYVGNYFGIVGVALVISILAILITILFSTVFKQKNELGMIIGFGCGIVFISNIMLNIACAFGLIPLGISFLPFMSLDRSGMILSYALLGVIMSIYKYKDIYPRHVSAKIKYSKKTNLIEKTRV